MYSLSRWLLGPARSLRDDFASGRSGVLTDIGRGSALPLGVTFCSRLISSLLAQCDGRCSVLSEGSRRVEHMFLPTMSRSIWCSGVMMQPYYETAGPAAKATA